MAIKMTALVFALMVGSVNAAFQANSDQYSGMVSLKAMEKVFARSERAHAESMSTIMASMTSEKAWRVLEKNNLTSPALVELTNHVHGKKAHLRKGPVTGYPALDGARKLLNDMIYTSLEKYDGEIAKCTQYYAQQCAGMENLRGQIAGSNYVAANSRALILGAEKTIEKCQADIPQTKQELKEHNDKCKDELARARTRLAVVEGDITVLTRILKMTECDNKTAFVQTKELKEQLKKLQSSSSKKLMNGEFKDLVTGIEGLQVAGFLQQGAGGLSTNAATKINAVPSKSPKPSFLQASPKTCKSYPRCAHLAGDCCPTKEGKMLDCCSGSQTCKAHPKCNHLAGDCCPTKDGVMLDCCEANKTSANIPPAPRTEVPCNPCTNPKCGLPNDAMRKKAGCELPRNSSQCYKLQEKFLLIQSGVADERDDLLSEVEFMESQCKETKETLETEIDDDQGMLRENEHDLAAATTKEANAAEEARQTAKKHEQMDGDLKRQMHTCTKNYIAFETELCAIKKIRGELYKMNGSTTPFFQDCVVSVWDPEECNKVCGGGEQSLTRNVLTHPENGAGCLPLEARRNCNQQPCPVDCKLDGWKGWSKCSADCGGGVQQRLRDVQVAQKFGGKQCGATSETRPCNNQACEKDCELGSWTAWDQCSKDCDGGTQKRMKFVTEQAEGAGKCPSRWSKERLEYKKCNMDSCMLLAGAQTLQCHKKLDVVILLDGSGSLGQRGWDAEIKAAKTFVSAFQGTGADAEIAVVLYSGPRTWKGVYKCFGKNTKNVNMETDCKIKSVSHFSGDLESIKTEIEKLEFPKGSTLTSLALLRAASELNLGRPDAKSIVVAITDGRPLSFRATNLASRFLRKHARLVWVPVTKNAPLADIKKWATRRWQENVVQVDNFAALENPDTVSHVVANICPQISHAQRR